MTKPDETRAAAERLADHYAALDRGPPDRRERFRRGMIAGEDKNPPAGSVGPSRVDLERAIRVISGNLIASDPKGYVRSQFALIVSVLKSDYGVD